MSFDTPLFCKVKSCNFARTHTTVSHKCGTCGKFGHGKVECNSQYKQDMLLLYHDDSMPISLWCTALECNKKEYHMIGAHYCVMCNVRGHCESLCPELSTIETEKMMKKNYIINKIYSQIQPGQFMKIFGGMGTYMICRKLWTGNIEGLYISTSTVYYDNKVCFMKYFTKGYIEVQIYDQTRLGHEF
jgi:hypothetical protein